MSAGLVKKLNGLKNSTTKSVKKAIDSNKYSRFVARTLSQYNSDNGADKVATVTYYAFLSLLPLLIAVLSVFDIVFRHNQHLHRLLINSTLRSIPVVGPTLNGDLSFVNAHGVTLVISLSTLLWSARRGGAALERSLCEINNLQSCKRNTWYGQLLHAYASTALIGIGLIVPTIFGALIKNPFLHMLVVLATVFWNAGVLYLLYRLLIRSNIDMIWGAFFGGVTLTAIQQASALILGHSLQNSRPLFGTLAVVLVILLWISLQVKTMLLGSEINKIRARH